MQIVLTFCYVRMGLWRRYRKIFSSIYLLFGEIRFPGKLPFLAATLSLSEFFTDEQPNVKFFNFFLQLCRTSKNTHANVPVATFIFWRVVLLLGNSVFNCMQPPLICRNSGVCRNCLRWNAATWVFSTFSTLRWVFGESVQKLSASNINFLARRWMLKLPLFTAKLKVEMMSINRKEI